MSQGFKTEADVMRNTAHRVDDTNQEVSAELSPTALHRGWSSRVLGRHRTSKF